MTDGEEAGLAHFNGGKNYATLGIVQKDGGKTFKYEEDGKATAGEALPSGTNAVWLRSSTGFDDVTAYSYSTDGQTFIPFGGAYKLKSASYRGDMIGIYTFNNETETGYVDVDFFHYEVKNK